MGYRLPSGSCEAIPPRLARLALPDAVADTLAPLSRHATALTAEIRAIESRLRARVATDPVVTRLPTVPGVGMIVATTFRALIDTVDRFHHAGQVSATMGLVPREDSSGRAPPSRPHHQSRID